MRSGFALCVNGFCIGFLGLALIRLWLQYYFYDLYFSFDVGWMNIASKFLRGCAILVLTWILYHTGLSRRADDALQYASFTLLTLSGVCLFLQRQGIAPDAMGIVGLVFGSSGIIWFGAMFISLFALMPQRQTQFYLVANLGLGSLLGVVFAYLPEAVVVVTLLFIPAAILLTYRQARSIVVARGVPYKVVDGNDGDRCYDDESPRAIVLVLVALALFTSVLGMSQGYASFGGIQLSFSMQLVHQLTVVAVTALLLVHFARGGSLNFKVVWTVEIALLMSALMIYLAPEGVPAELGATLSEVPVTLWLAIAFLICDDFARHSSYKPYQVLGLVYGIYLVTFNGCRAIGAHSGLFMDSPAIGFALMAFLLAIGGTLMLVEPVFSSRPLFGRSGSESGSVFSRPGDENGLAGLASMRHLSGEVDTKDLDFVFGPDSVGVAWLMDVKGLSDREVQVAVYIAQGRTRRFIAEELCISDNTVRNHVRNIYRKVGVNNKQGFLDALRNSRRTAE